MSVMRGGAGVRPVVVLLIVVAVVLVALLTWMLLAGNLTLGAANAGVSGSAAPQVGAGAPSNSWSDAGTSLGVGGAAQPLAGVGGSPSGGWSDVGSSGNR